MALDLVRNLTLWYPVNEPCGAFQMIFSTMLRKETICNKISANTKMNEPRLRTRTSVCAACKNILQGRKWFERLSGYFPFSSCESNLRVDAV